MPTQTQSIFHVYRHTCLLLSSPMLSLYMPPLNSHALGVSSWSQVSWSTCHLHNPECHPLTSASIQQYGESIHFISSNSLANYLVYTRTLERRDLASKPLPSRHPSVQEYRTHSLQISSGLVSSGIVIFISPLFTSFLISLYTRHSSDFWVTVSLSHSTNNKPQWPYLDSTTPPSLISVVWCRN